MAMNLYRVIRPVSDIEVATRFFSAVFALGPRGTPIVFVDEATVFTGSPDFD